MATLEITTTNKPNRSSVTCETFEISRELAQELIAKLETLVAELPDQHRITRIVRPDGATVIEIEHNRDVPPMVHPNFEKLFRHREKFNNDPKTESPSDTPPS